MTPSPQRQDVTESDAFTELLRGSFVPTAVVGLLAVVVGMFSGPKAAWSAALGAVLVLAFFTVSLLAMKRTAHLAPTAVMLVVMVTYTVKILALGLVMVVLRDAAWVSGYAVGRHHHGLHAGVAVLRDACLQAATHLCLHPAGRHPAGGRSVSRPTRVCRVPA